MRAAAGSMRRKSITARYIFAAGNGLAINDARPGAQARRHATLGRLRLAQGTARSSMSTRRPSAQLRDGANEPLGIRNICSKSWAPFAVNLDSVP